MILMTVNVIHNFISYEYAKTITDNCDVFLSKIEQRQGYFEDNYPREAFPMSEYKNHPNERAITEDSKTADMFISNAMYLTQKKIEEFYDCTITKYEGNLVKLTAGAHNGLHSDMYMLDGSPWNDGTGREDELEYSALLYLSDYGVDFFGGEISFPQHNLVIYPKIGDLVFFRGDLEHTHEVSRVIGGNRYAIIMFLGK